MSFEELVDRFKKENDELGFMILLATLTEVGRFLSEMEGFKYPPIEEFRKMIYEHLTEIFGKPGDVEPVN